LGVATNDRVVEQAQAGFDATWEIDLFGRNQNRSAEAQALFQSAQAQEQAVMVGLLSEVARSYFDLREYERQVALTQKNLETQTRTVELIGAQVKGAMASEFDVQRAAAQLSTTQALLPTVQSAYDAALNRLNVLLGYPPGTKDTLLKTPQALKPVDPAILVAAPATVLANRPDVRAAERRLAGSVSARRAAIAELFPRVSLLGFFGVQTSDLFNTTPWSVGASAVQPLLNFGRLRSQIRVSKARQKQAFYDYEQTVLEALENMETSLSRFLHEFDRNKALGAAVAQNRKAAELAKLQFTGGFTGLLDVLVAERSLLDAEASLASSDATLRKNLVSVYAAAGGGWDTTVR
jgi:multidrug efflux system outer membrane protein